MKNFLIWVAVIALVVAAIFSIPRILRLVLGTDEPMLTVISGSMWPVLTRGDVVFVEKASREDIRVGTVIIFHYSGGLAIHRIISIQGNVITTKGDANPVADNPITYSDVVGRALTIDGRLIKIPWVGHIAIALHPASAQTGTSESIADTLKSYVVNPVGFVLVIVLPLLLLFGGYLGSALSSLMPQPARKQRQRFIRQRLIKRCGETRARRILRY